jgi:death-associated protein kinase
MIERPDSDIVKLVGFNKAQRLKDEADIRIVFGNPEFVAPEVLSYDPVYTATDMWSVGVVVYVMLSGLSPFYSDSAQLFNHNIQAAAYSFNDDCFDIISIEAKKFIRQLLIADSRHRWTANDCLQSTWLQTPVPDTELDTTYLQEFVARRRGKETVAPPTPKRKASFAFVQPIRLRMASPELRDPCPPSFPAQIRDMFVDVGRTVNFICSVLGYPEPIVTWYRDGIELHPANDRRIKIRYGADVQSLIIANVERSDSGQYLCRAENRFGQAATTAALVVAVTPAAPYQPSANQLEHTTALVCWEAPTSQDNNPIMSYEIERRRTDQDTWEIAASDITSCSFICKGLLPGQEYQFRIIAVYKEGRSKPSDPTGVVAIDEHDASNDVVVQKQDPGRLYDMKGEIGRGQFGTVLKCEEKQTRRQFAAKHIGVVGQALSEDAKRELEVLQMTCHPRLALLEAAFQTETHLILIEELVDGGTLLNHLASFQEFTEEDAVFYIRQILEGLDYLHQRNIAYLDLKPENVLLTASHRDVKLIDFGEARIVTDWTTVSKNSSRLDFMAPEALNSRSVVTETDVWSVGIVIVTILAGMPPFLTATETETIEHICNLQFVDEKASFSPMSAQAEQCVRHMLVIEPSLRPSAADCTKLTWLKATAAQSGKRSATLVKTDRLKVFVVDRAAKFRLV